MLKQLVNNVEIIASDFSGIIHSFNSYNTNWKTRIINNDNSPMSVNIKYMIMNLKNLLLQFVLFIQNSELKLIKIYNLIILYI